MTSRTVAVILYIVGVICVVVGVLDVTNIADWNQGTGWGLIVGGVICIVIGALIDPRRSRL